MSSAEIDASEFYPQKVYHCLRLTSFFDKLYEEDCIRNEDIMIALNNDLINGNIFSRSPEKKFNYCMFNSPRTLSIGCKGVHWMYCEGVEDREGFRFGDES